MFPQLFLSIKFSFCDTANEDRRGKNSKLKVSFQVYSMLKGNFGVFLNFEGLTLHTRSTDIIGQPLKGALFHCLSYVYRGQTILEWNYSDMGTHLFVFPKH